jgi:hypothetical protein
MNRVHIHLEKVGTVGDKGDFTGTISDNYVEDIELSFLADPDLLSKPTEEIVKLVAEKDGETADVVEAAIQNGTDVYLNDEPEMDHDAYKALSASATPGPR